MAPFEQKIAGVLSLQELVRDRSRLPMLQQDLAWHGINHANLPLCAQIPEFRSDPQALGALYVIEGSTLGGQLLARKIERELGLREGRGYSFFVAYGDSTGRMWKQFVEHVNQLSEEDGQTAIHSARYTFDQIHSWLAQA